MAGSRAGNLPVAQLADFIIAMRSGTLSRVSAANLAAQVAELVEISGSAGVVTTEVTGTAYSITEDDLSGNRVLVFTNTSAVTVTLPAGLTSTQPMTIIQGGAGTVTLAADDGVTILSYNSAVALAGEEAWASIIPMGDETYRLGGNLA